MVGGCFLSVKEMGLSKLEKAWFAMEKTGERKRETVKEKQK